MAIELEEVMISQFAHGYLEAIHWQRGVAMKLIAQAQFHRPQKMEL
jgi:hypothetical protein